MASMTQEQLDARLAELGGGLAHAAIAGQKRIPNPKYRATDVRSSEPEFIEVDVEQWRSKSGHILQAVHNADGTWNVVQDEPGATKPGADEATPQVQDAAELLRQKKANAALPKDQDPAYETDEERRARGARVIKEQGEAAQRDDTTPVSTEYTGTGKNRTKVTKYKSGRTVTEAAPTNATATGTKYEADGTKVTTYDDGTSTREQKDPATVAAEKQANAPKPVPDGNGGFGYWDQSTPPKWVSVSGPQAAQKPVEVRTGVWGVWKPGATGEPPTFVQIDIPEARNTARNVDPFNPDFADPTKDLGLGKWSQAQRAKIGLPPDQGGITQAEYDAAVKEAHERAGVSISNLTSAHSVVRQQAIDYEAQRHNLSGEADSDFKNAVGMFNSVLLGADPDTGSIRNVIPGMMAEQKKYREERQATAKPMASLHPMFQQAAAESVAKAQPPAATENAAGTGPTPAPYTPPTPPNALGLGAIPGGMTPGVPDAQAASAAAEAERQQAMAGAPPAFMPPPPISGQSIVPGMGAPGMSPQSVAPPPAPMPLPAPTTPMTTLPAVNPATGEPTGLPQTPVPVDPNGPVPVGQVPGPLTAFAQSVAPPPPPTAPTPGAPMNPAIANVAQQASVRQFDPYNAAGRLASLGVPPEVIAEALKRSGLVGQGSM